MNLNKGKCKILPLRRNNPRHQYILGTDWLESSSEEKDLGVLVDSKLNINQQCTVAARKVTNSVLHYEDHCQQVKGGSFSHLLNTREVKSGVLCPVLDSTIQERHGHTGVSPPRGYKD